MSTRARRAAAVASKSRQTAAVRSPFPQSKSNKRKSGGSASSPASGGEKKRKKAAAKAAKRGAQGKGGHKRGGDGSDKHLSSEEVSSSEEERSSSADDNDDDDNDDDDDDDDEQGQDDLNDGENDDGDNHEAASGLSSSSSSSAQEAAVISLHFNTALLTIPNSCAWKPVLSNEDYTTLQMLLTESVMRSLPHCHIQDPRSVENIARHVAWTQIWDINQARLNDYKNLTALDKAHTPRIVSATVQHCVNLALRSETCILFNRIWDNQRLFRSLQDHLHRCFPSIKSGGQQIFIDAFIGEAVDFVKSTQFLDLVCKEMFSKEGMPRFQCTEAVWRRLFEEWNEGGATTKAMKDFLVRIVDRTSHVFINTRVRQYLE